MLPLPVSDETQTALKKDLYLLTTGLLLILLITLLSQVNPEAVSQEKQPAPPLPRQLVVTLSLPAIDPAEWLTAANRNAFHLLTVAELDVLVLVNDQPLTARPISLKFGEKDLPSPPVVLKTELGTITLAADSVPFDLNDYRFLPKGRSLKLRATLQFTDAADAYPLKVVMYARAVTPPTPKVTRLFSLKSIMDQASGKFGTLVTPDMVEPFARGLPEEFKPWYELVADMFDRGEISSVSTPSGDVHAMAQVVVYPEGKPSQQATFPAALWSHQEVSVDLRNNRMTITSESTAFDLLLWNNIWQSAMNNGDTLRQKIAKRLEEKVGRPVEAKATADGWRFIITNSKPRTTETKLTFNLRFEAVVDRLEEAEDSGERKLAVTSCRFQPTNQLHPNFK